MLSLKKFSVYEPADLWGGQSSAQKVEKDAEKINKKLAGPAGKYMILGKILCLFFFT